MDGMVLEVDASTTGSGAALVWSTAFVTTRAFQQLLEVGRESPLIKQRGKRSWLCWARERIVLVGDALGSGLA